MNVLLDKTSPYHHSPGVALAARFLFRAKPGYWPKTSLELWFNGDRGRKRSNWMCAFQKMEIPNFDTELLHFFKVLMENQSLTQTAERLGLSQASASRFLARLRVLFGDELFVRTRHGLKPTARAEAALAPLLATLSSVEQLLQPASFSSSTMQGTIKIGAADNGVLTIISHVIEELFEKAPQVSLEIVPIHDDLYDHLQNGTLDLAIYPNAPLPPDFHKIDLFEETYVCVVRKKHPLAHYVKEQQVPPAEEINRYKRMVITVRGGRLGHVVSALPYHEMSQKTALWVPYFLGAPFLLEKTDLTLVVPKRLALRFCEIAPLVILPSPKPSKTFRPRLIWHHRVHKNPAIRWVRELFQKHAKVM